MRNKQLLYLFSSNWIILFVGMGLFPLLPLYATNFGATPTIIGFYFALTYGSNMAGTMLTEWFVRRLTRKGAFVASALVGLPALILLGQATALWQVVFLTAVLWFCGGLSLALSSVLTGLHASGKRRGISFTLMFLTYPLGALSGGAAVGTLVEARGYPFMFAALGVVWTALPLLGVFALKDKPVDKPAVAVTTVGDSAPLGRQFRLLLLVTLLSSVAINVSRLGTPLSMQTFAFSPGAVASTATVSGLATLPLALLLGILSDRLGRERFLTLAYAAAGCGALTLMMASKLWHFWLAATLVAVAFCASGAVASALATDVLPPARLSRGLPWVKAMNPMAAIASFASTGYVLDTFGPRTLYTAAALLAIAAVLSVRALRPRREQIAGLQVVEGQGQAV